MKTTIAEFRNALLKITAQLQIPQKEANDYVEAMVAHYLEDNFFKGFKGVHGAQDWIEKLKKSQDAETVVFASDSLLQINGAGKSPFTIIIQRYDQICEAASKAGAYTVTIQGQYMSALFYTVRKFANDGYLVVLASNGGPQGTVPFGGKNDIFGTNPIAYGVPSSSDPIVFDGATSKRAWGLIEEAKKSGTTLPANTYFDAAGNYTTDPHKAVKIEAFGEYKGYAINLLLEVLTSALVGGVAGRKQSSEAELGTWLYVVDPAVFGSKETFITQVDRLKEEITSTEPREGFERVVYPGMRAFEHAQAMTDDSEIEIEDSVWEQITQYPPASAS